MSVNKFATSRSSISNVTMILILLLVGVCMGHGSVNHDTLEPRPPRYLRATHFLGLALEAIEAHILSMEEVIPDLTDHRRYYAVVAHVVFIEAVQQAGCLVQPYEEFYQKHINKTAPEALSNPKLVVEETRALVDTFNEKTARIQRRIKTNCDENMDQLDCDVKIQRAVSYYKSHLKTESQVLLVAGEFAEELFRFHSEFAAVSYAFNPYRYLVGAGKELEGLVTRLARLLKSLAYEELRC